MLKTKFMVLAALAAFVMTPVAVSAEEGAPKISYSAKKQGRVAFQDRAQDKAPVAQDTASEINPADIEPAAGDFESEERTRENALAKSMRLPRKN